MRTSVTCPSTDGMTRRKAHAGYTLLEMVVVLAIMALVTGVAAVRVFSLISSWRERTTLNGIEEQFSHLPVLARQRGEEIVLPPPASSEAEHSLTAGEVPASDSSTAPQALVLPAGWLVRFDHHLRVRANGFCEGAKIQLEHGDRHYPRLVTAPLCQLLVTPAVAP
jgi:prepilin-type N-terminal cleavage/methylation domain-containing protein